MKILREMASFVSRDLTGIDFRGVDAEIDSTFFDHSAVVMTQSTSLTPFSAKSCLQASSFLSKHGMTLRYHTLSPEIPHRRAYMVFIRDPVTCCGDLIDERYGNIPCVFSDIADPPGTCYCDDW